MSILFYKATMIISQCSVVLPHLTQQRNNFEKAVQVKNRVQNADTEKCFAWFNGIAQYITLIK
jgi:hypothetical protein